MDDERVNTTIFSQECFCYAVRFLLKKKKHAHHQAVMIFIFRPFLKSIVYCQHLKKSTKASLLD